MNALKNYANWFNATLHNWNRLMSFRTPTICCNCLSKLIARISLISLSVFTHCVAIAETTGVAQTTRAKPSVVDSDSVISVVLSLLFVVAVIFMLAWVMRRMGMATLRPNSLLKTVSSLSVGQRERIVLVQVGEQQLLLGVAQGRVETLHVLETPLSVEQKDATVSGSFAERLKSIVNKEK